MNVAKIDWNAIPWTPVRPGVERKGFTGAGATLALHRLHPGHEPKPHSHPNEQVVYILAGTIDFHIEDQVHRLTTGGLLVIPPNVTHHGIVIGDEIVLNLDVFTPIRPEYA